MMIVVVLLLLCGWTHQLESESPNAKRDTKPNQPPLLNTSHYADQKMGNSVSLFFQVIKMYKKWRSELSSDNGLIVLPLKNDTVVLMNQSDNSTVPDMPESSALVGKIPGRRKYLVSGVVSQPSPESCSEFCSVAHHTIGLCLSPNDCYRRGGTASNPCCGNFYVCCQFLYQCGETSEETIAHFQSTEYPVPQRGTLACDFELVIGEDVCAVRVDFAHVSLQSKFGGVCDVDQILILNSVDGPTTSQCGELTGYTTTVAVLPAQQAPLKVVVIVQTEETYFWDIRLRQVQCDQLKHFKRPEVCGSKPAHDTSESFYQMLDLWRNAAWHPNGQHSEAVWWRQPGPTFNRFYYENGRRAFEGEIRESFAEDRIIGGQDAELNEFPWQVAIVSKRVFFCGGVLINDEYVLSAAHCFLTQETIVADLVVYLGDHDLTSSNETISEIRGVREVHYHAHFHALLLSNDIALLRLDRPVSFSLRIRPACLPQQDFSSVGNRGVVSGWGITSYPDGKPNAVLQKLRVRIMDHEFCESNLGEELGPGNLCAVPIEHGGTCFGDSGGPLTILQENKDTLIGIVSFGITGCALAPGMPDLYTRVSAYLRWIEVSAIKY